MFRIILDKHAHTISTTDQPPTVHRVAVVQRRNHSSRMQEEMLQKIQEKREKSVQKLPAVNSRIIY